MSSDCGDRSKKSRDGYERRSSCSCDGSTSNSSVRQTLDEMNFERGIWYAAQQNDLNRVRKLLDKNGRVKANEEDNAGYTALHYASRNGHVDVCKILLDNGARVDSTTRSGKATSLHRSATQGHIEVVELLLKAKADVDLRDADGYTALHRAVDSRRLNVVKYLIPFTDLNLKDNKGRNARQFAEEIGCEDIVDCFLPLTFGNVVDSSS